MYRINYLRQSFHFRQGSHKIPAPVALAMAFVACALLLPFLEDEPVFQHETGAIGQTFHRDNVFVPLVVLPQHPLQVLVGGAAGLDVLQVQPQGVENVLRKDVIGHKRLQ